VIGSTERAAAVSSRSVVAPSSAPAWRPHATRAALALHRLADRLGS
jgi:hypothetical protein